MSEQVGGSAHHTQTNAQPFAHLQLLQQNFDEKAQRLEWLAQVMAGRCQEMRLGRVRPLGLLLGRL